MSSAVASFFLNQGIYALTPGLLIPGELHIQMIARLFGISFAAFPALLIGT
jgi:hypothetical protein